MQLTGKRLKTAHELLNLLLKREITIEEFECGLDDLEQEELLELDIS